VWMNSAEAVSGKGEAAEKNWERSGAEPCLRIRGIPPVVFRVRNELAEAAFSLPGGGPASSGSWLPRFQRGGGGRSIYSQAQWLKGESTTGKTKDQSKKETCGNLYVLQTHTLYRSVCADPRSGLPTHSRMRGAGQVFVSAGKTLHSDRLPERNTAATH